MRTAVLAACAVLCVTSIAIADPSVQERVAPVEAEDQFLNPPMYRFGAPRSYSEAAKLYEAAAEQGNAGAAYQLGIMYYAGLLSKDYAQAERWLLAAAELDAEGNIDWPSWPIGRRLMSARSSALILLCKIIGADAVLRLQAEKGNPYAQLELGDVYSSDLDDGVAAYAWYTVAYEQWVVMDHDERDRRTKKTVFRSSVHLETTATAYIASNLMISGMTTEQAAEGQSMAHELQARLPPPGIRWGGMPIQCSEAGGIGRNDLDDSEEDFQMLWNELDPTQRGVTTSELVAHLDLIATVAIDWGVRYDGPYGQPRSYTLTPADSSSLSGETPGGMNAYIRNVGYHLLSQYMSSDELMSLNLIPSARDRHLLEPTDGDFMPPPGAYRQLPIPGRMAEGWHIIKDIAPEALYEYEQMSGPQDRARFAVSKLQMLTDVPRGSLQRVLDQRTEVNETTMFYYMITGVIHAYRVDTRTGAFAVQLTSGGPWYPAVPPAHGFRS